MAYTFLKAEGQPVGKSLVEEDKIPFAKELLQQAKTHKVKFLLPTDHMIADRVEANALTKIVGRGQPIPDSMMALDIGPETIETFSEEIARARTIVWNGPMGVFELPAFAKGTNKIAQAVAENAGAIDHRGRRRFSRRGKSRRRSRQNQPHLDWRRSVPGISGRRKAAGSGSSDG